MHDNPNGDDRFYNNLLVGRGDLSAYDTARLPVQMEGNVFLHGAKPSRHEAQPVVTPDFNPGIKLVEKADGLYLEGRLMPSWSRGPARKLVTTELLGKATIPSLPYERPDGTPLCIDTDYLGKSRFTTEPVPGPFEASAGGTFSRKVWELPNPSPTRPPR
jgi:alpha-N-arabinofuranosidase